jgi:hypothetical protein
MESTTTTIHGGLVRIDQHSTGVLPCLLECRFSASGHFLYLKDNEAVPLGLEKKVIAVSWADCCLPKEEGGLASSV